VKQRAVILGAGESGCGSAILAESKGFDVFVSDSGTIKDKYRTLLNAYNIEFEEKQHSKSKILNSDIIIKSPGIPDNAPLILEAHRRNINVISEIEFGGRYCNAFKICVTGSNGKTTTSNLIYHILKRAGLKVGLAGNVGFSYCQQVATRDFDYYVIELSSFQLDGMFEFKADVAVLLNITPDHLDRYDYDLSKYIASKFRITNNQRESEYLIYWADDPILKEEIKKRKPGATLLPFSDTKSKGMASFIEEDYLSLNIHNKSELLMSIHDLALKGRHNTYNSMAASIAGKIVNIRKDVIRECLSDFQGVEHRLETILSVHGINFINDSKATNVNSTWYALECMPDNIVWIAGGVDKGNEYAELAELTRKKVKAIVCLGTDNEKIKRAFEGIVSTIVETESMAEAVKSSYYLASTGDTVLLSPACASFDLFKSYEDRGRQFKEAVRNL
jgi:UDP-N-acetylmuramoylalanine--D-glutamate ligase